MVDKTNKTSKAKIEANRRYNEKTFDVLQCRIKKEENINGRIDEAVNNIRIQTGNKDYSKATFILEALKAKLDGTSFVQAENALTIPLSDSMIRNMNGAISCHYSDSQEEYAIRAINEQLKRDIAEEKEKRRKAREDKYYRQYEDSQES